MKPNLEYLEPRDCPTPVLFHGGPVLANPQLSALYVGVGQQTALMDVIAGPYAALMSPYGVGAGAFVGSASVPDPGPISDSGVQALLTAEIKSGALPEPGPNSAYLVLLPRNVTDANQANGSGYHAYFMLAGHPVVYGVTYPQYYPTLGGESIPESHEAAEMFTDPLLNAWYGSGETGEEIADLYNWVGVMLNGQQVSQFALPSGAPAIVSPAPPAPPPVAAGPALSSDDTFAYLTAIPIETVDALAYRLFALIDPRDFAGHAAVTQEQLARNPAISTPLGQAVEQQAVAVVAAWVHST